MARSAKVFTKFEHFRRALLSRRALLFVGSGFVQVLQGCFLRPHSLRRALLNRRALLFVGSGFVQVLQGCFLRSHSLRRPLLRQEGPPSYMTRSRGAGHPQLPEPHSLQVQQDVERPSDVDGGASDQRRDGQTSRHATGEGQGACCNVENVIVEPLIVWQSFRKTSSLQASSFQKI